MTNLAGILKQLIIEKYGEDKFLTGCQLVAQWVSFELKDCMFSPKYIETICRNHEVKPLPVEVDKAIRKLFGISQAEEKVKRTRCVALLRTPP